MNKKCVGGGLVLGLAAGITIDNLALGIMLGLMFGAEISFAKAWQENC